MNDHAFLSGISSSLLEGRSWCEEVDVLSVQLQSLQDNKSSSAGYHPRGSFASLGPPNDTQGLEAVYSVAVGIWNAPPVDPLSASRQTHLHFKL